MSSVEWDLAEIGAEANSVIRLKKMAVCFLSPPQLNWFHKVLSFICQGGKLKLNVAFRAGRVHYNRALTIQ